MIIRDAREVAPLLEQAELSVAALYRSCAERFAEHADFWGRLADEELRHAEYIRRGAEVIARNPVRFRVSPDFDHNAVRRFVRRVDEARRMVEDGGMDEPGALRVAWEAEGTYIEQRFADTFYGKAEELLSLLREIDRDTLAHRRLLREKLDALYREPVSAE